MFIFPLFLYIRRNSIRNKRFKLERGSATTCYPDLSQEERDSGKLSEKYCFTTVWAMTFHFSSFQVVCIREITLRLMGHSNCVPAEQDRLIQHTMVPDIVCARQESVLVERNIPDGQCCGKSICPTLDFFYFCCSHLNVLDHPHNSNIKTF